MLWYLRGRWEGSGRKQPLFPCVREEGKVPAGYSVWLLSVTEWSIGPSSTWLFSRMKLFRCEASTQMKGPGMWHTGENLSPRENILLGGIFVLKSALQPSPLTFWRSIGQLSWLSPPLSPQTSLLHLPARDKAGWLLVVRNPGKVWITT